MEQIAILLLAAGASTRMEGSDKLLEPVVGGVPLLADRLRVALATGHGVWVALPPRLQSPERWKIAAEFGARIVEIPQPQMGLSASLKGLITALPASSKGALVLPADMPDITLGDLKSVLQAFDPKRVVRGAVNTKAGHPVLFPADWFSRLQELTGDRGARDMLKSAGPLLVPLPDTHALTDLDTPEDWAKWRAINALD